MEKKNDFELLNEMLDTVKGGDYSSEVVIFTGENAAQEAENANQEYGYNCSCPLNALGSGK